MWPVPKQYGINQPFRKQGQYWKACGWHTGVDFAAPLGAPVYATISGTIRHRSYGSWAGPYQFAISPSKGQPFAAEECFYAHVLSRLPDGTEVKAGQVISKVGNLGNVTGPHLHLERHSQKNAWNCGVMRDPYDMLVYGGQTQTKPWNFGSGAKVYSSKAGAGGHLTNPDKVSDSIKMIEEMLDRHSMPGGKSVPITGKWTDRVDEECRLCQKLHVPPADPAGKAYIGPSQFAHLKKATGAPYTWMDDGPPPNITVTPPEQKPEQPEWDGNWHVPSSLKALKVEMDVRWPDRDRSSDGTIGDAAHSVSKSEHNPVGHPYGPTHGTKGAVHAMDITAKGIDVPEVMDALIGDHRLWYVIHDGHIYSKTYGWAKRPYNGSNPHTTHIHVSLAADDQASALRNELDTATWLETKVRPEQPEVPTEPEGPETGDYVTREEYDELLEEFDTWRAAVGEAFTGQ